MSPSDPKVGAPDRRKRSRNGCINCKASKLKCDEQIPKCGRCSRLCMECLKPDVKPSLWNRRRGNGPLKSRESWKPKAIWPAPQEPESTWVTNRTDPSLVSDQLSLDKDLNTAPLFEFDWLFCSNDLFTSQGNGLLDFQGDTWMPSLPSWNITSQRAIPYHDKDAILEIPERTSSPCSLTSCEQKGISYFKTTYSLTRHTRPFRWSCQELFLSIARKQPLVMHFILAVSLRQLVEKEHVSGQDFDTLFRKHYRKGLDALKKRLADDNPQPEHLSTMISAWLLYHAILDKVTNGAVRERKRLSTEIYAYIAKHALVQHCVTSLTAQTNPSKARKEQSLLAKVLIWLFYVDTRFGFTNTGDSIATRLMLQEEDLKQLFDVSQLALELNWGPEYPAVERIYAVECLGLDQLNYDIQVLHHRMNRVFWFGIGCLETIKRSLDSLEARYSSMFRLAGEALSEYTRMLQRVDILSCEFYALKINWFRCSDCNVQSEMSSTIHDIVKRLLRNAHRIWERSQGPAYFDRQLFLVGIETDDLIHRDWLLDRLHESQIKDALTCVWQRQDTQQGRASAGELRQIITDAFTLK